MSHCSCRGLGIALNVRLFSQYPCSILLHRSLHQYNKSESGIMSNEIILYDLPSKAGTCWSLNPWKGKEVDHQDTKDTIERMQWVFK